ncbi:MAG: long-chain fatty acid--CoA ligase [Actinomycetota bacterium]|nr:long-chain fatty acid--CoA ligase [Actinomycetota bacterium]
MSGVHSIGSWLPQRAALTPGRVALEFAGEQVTYQELLSRSRSRAAAFSAAGLRHGDRVAVLAQNCPEQVEVFFACAMAGLVLVPLNWRLRATELAYQLRDSGASLLLYGESYAELAGDALAECEGELEAEPLVAQETLETDWTAPGVEDDDPLLIIYTSGTTGHPKGAVLSHANTFWTNLSLDLTANVDSSDIVLQILPQSHVGGWNVQPLLAWWKGAKVVLEPGFDAGRVLRIIEEKRVTTMMGVPTNYLLMAAHEDFATADLSSLRQLVVGGAPMPVALLDQWLARGVIVLQGYGLSEAAPNVLCVPSEYAKEKLGSAGRPYMHVEVALRRLGGEEADSRDGPLVFLREAGSGELLVRGPNVFVGYWGNPEATARTLRDGWLLTGDVAERDDDGFYWIRGRIKEMYISGGENVYPAEVAEVISGHPLVLQAAVVGVPHPRWGETGYAFVVLKARSALSAEELDAYCRSRLATFKVPGHYSFVPELPYLSSGKLDMRGLGETALSRVGDGSGSKG